jgi:hypothetical protein
MKYIKKFESFENNRYFWKVELDYFELSQTKIKIPIGSPDLKMTDEIYSWGDDDDKIFITHDESEWSWSGTWNYDTLIHDDYEYLGEIILEPYEKKGIKYNL